MKAWLHWFLAYTVLDLRSVIKLFHFLFCMLIFPILASQSSYHFLWYVFVVILKTLHFMIVRVMVLVCSNWIQVIHSSDLGLFFFFLVISLCFLLLLFSISRIRFWAIWVVSLTISCLVSFFPSLFIFWISWEIFCGKIIDFAIKKFSRVFSYC